MAHNDCTMKDVKREPLSPPISECSDRDQHTSLGSTSSDGKEEGDQPLDFSMKKTKSERVSNVSDHSDDSCESELNNRHHHGLTNGHSTSYVSDSDISKTSDDQDNSRIGEPQTALLTLPGTPVNAGMVFPGLPPGILPGTPNSHESLGSHFPGSVLSSVDPRKSLAGSNAKHTRPFKAYPKDPLSLPLGGYYGIPGFMPFPLDGQTTATAQALTMTSDELFNQYRTQIMKTQDDTRKRLLPKSHSSSNSTGSESTSATSGTNTAISQPAKSATSNHRPSTPTTPSTTTSSSRKRGKSLPDEQKDDAYWERRRKNNEAAKRSRDARRAKEDEIAIRAAFLEQENLKLRVEVAALKNETAKLRCMLYNS